MHLLLSFQVFKDDNGNATPIFGVFSYPQTPVNKGNLKNKDMQKDRRVTFEQDATQILSDNEATPILQVKKNKSAAKRQPDNRASMDATQVFGQDTQTPVLSVGNNYGKRESIPSADATQIFCQDTQSPVLHVTGDDGPNKRTSVSGADATQLFGSGDATMCLDESQVG